MKKIKPRKPRGIKQNGEPSYDMCPYCKMPNCDPFGASLLYRKKLDARRKAGVCESCGHNPCRCKSSLTLRNPVYR